MRKKQKVVPPKERECKICKEVKDIEEFPSQIKGGWKYYRYRCKTCMGRRLMDYWKKRDWGREAYLRGRVERAKRAKEKFPHKYRARLTARMAISKGTLMRLPCEVCGGEKVHAHHDDYSKPLDVRWLCAKHHNELHKKLKAQPKNK